MWNKYKKGIKLNWWQAGIFKSAAVSFGILLGIFFYSLLTPLMPLFIIVFLTASSYVLWLWFNQ